METNEVSILIYAFTCILLALGIFLILFYFLFKQKQKVNRMKIIALNQELLQTQIEIQERTLKMVSQEIHDNIGQALSLVKLNLHTVERITDAEGRSKLADTKDLVSKAITDLRDLTKSMHGDKIAEIGLQNAVDHELKIIRNTGLFQTQMTVTGEVYQLKPSSQTVLFRITQEALHNSIKHSKAKNIVVSFNFKPSEFELVLRDDGLGFDMGSLKSSETGIGLKSMKDRAALTGGQLLVSSSPGNGTTISIKVAKNSDAKLNLLQ